MFWFTRDRKPRLAAFESVQQVTVNLYSRLAFRAAGRADAQNIDPSTPRPCRSKKIGECSSGLWGRSVAKSTLFYSRQPARTGPWFDYEYRAGNATEDFRRNRTQHEKPLRPRMPVPADRFSGPGRDHRTSKSRRRGFVHDHIVGCCLCSYGRRSAIRARCSRDFAAATVMPIAFAASTSLNSSWW